MEPELIPLFSWELESMGEYSCSIPTGTTIGKKWKCNRNAYRSQVGQTEPKELQFYSQQMLGPLPPDWWVGEYVEDPDPKMVGIVWRKVIILEGPYPRNWRRPDWDCDERRRREAVQAICS